MGSLERKLKRNAMKQKFASFSDEFNRLKRNGQRVNGHLLGKKPSFNEFKHRLQYVEDMNRKQREELAKKPVDLEWKENE